ncbi:MAG: hypothetical protein GF308_09625 [Candidatus Heimdallarchaeota archaeon]|nr:hypothetical protein [Candidatus Heimdallarchaeota archaeon]
MKTVVVLCVPRSGSSLLAGILHHLGVYMGPSDHLEKGGHVNKHGCFENQDFLSLSHNILYEADSPVGLIELPDETKLQSSVENNEQKIKSVINKHQQPLWGWKDPSTFHIIPYIHEFLENPHYIVMKRNVNNIVNSTKKIAKMGKFFPSLKHELSLYESGQRLSVLKRFFSIYFSRGNVFKDAQVMRAVIKKSYKKMNHFSSDKKHLTLKFEQILNKPKKSIKRIARFLDIDLGDDEKFQSALHFVNPDLVNFS